VHKIAMTMNQNGTKLLIGSPQYRTAGRGAFISAGSRGAGNRLREYRSMSHRSTVPSVPYSRMNAIRLIHSQVTLTVGEIPSLVSMMPCTIHGCLPLSVSNQPAVFIRNGSTAAQVASTKNTREVASVLRQIAHRPHSVISSVSTPR